MARRVLEAEPDSLAQSLVIVRDTRHCSRAARHRAHDVWPLLLVLVSALFNSLADQVRGDRSDMLQRQRFMPWVNPSLAGGAASMLAAVIGDVR